MGLPSAPFAYDTETDRLDPDDPETTYCCLVQICAVDAADPSDSILIESEDAVGDFLDLLEDTSHDCEMHCYNLGNYEFEWLRGALIRKGYMNEDMPEGRSKRKLQPHSWRVMYDLAGVFKMEIRNRDGYTLLIKDSMKIFHPAMSMKEVADSIRKLHPDWWSSVDDVKTKVGYNQGWHFTGKDREAFIFYSRLDAFSQAMILRYLIQTGMDSKLSAAGWGLTEALQLRYGHEADWENKREFKARYPPLPDEWQLFVEERTIGGQVWGLTGTHFGHFSKWDYKSSYPAEYHHGDLMIGKVRILTPGDAAYERIRSSPNHVRWFKVRFHAKLREGRMPCLNAKEAGRTRFVNAKMDECDVDGFYAEALLIEIAYRYELTDVVIEEMWYAHKRVGDFADVIEYNFNKKETSKGALKVKAKLNLNGGIHGKTITKSQREKRVFARDGEDDEERWVAESTEAQFCIMIGFTAMQNARARLLKHCRAIEDAGFTIYMCDTDSLITDATAEQVREILGDACIQPGEKGIQILGRLELEAEFTCFKCWGLKRYCELDGFIPERSDMFAGFVIGSAFAGMHEELQERLLPFWKTDGTLYSWKQLSKRRLKRDHGTILEPAEKHAGSRDVWWRDDMDLCDRAVSRLMGKLGEEQTQMFLESYYSDLAASSLDKIGNEDMIAYLEDIRYDEIDPYWRRHVEKAYNKAINGEKMFYDW